MFGISSKTLGLEFRAPVQKDGSFEFLRVPMGTYKARFDPEPVGINPITVVVGKSDLTGMEISLPDRVPVSGKVLIDDYAPFSGHTAPLPALRIWLIGTDIQPAADGVEVLPATRDLALNGDGSFATVLPTGEYRVTVEGVVAPHTVRRVTDGKTDLLAEPLRVTDGGTKDLSVAISLSTFAVKGRVSYRGRNIPDGVQVSISRMGQAIAHAPVAADGTFGFPGIPPGPYSVRVEPAGMPIPVDVSAKDVSGLEFSLLKGRAIFPAGAAPPHPVLSFSNDSGANAYIQPVIRSDGTFEFALPLGEFRAWIAGNLTQYVLALVRDGKSEAAETVGEVRFSSRDDVELKVIFK
jgi:hypothetical protein